MPESQSSAMMEAFNRADVHAKKARQPQSEA
jgi:hypothetical protein